SPEPSENDWLAANQVTVVDGEHARRFDVVLYLNGMPVAAIELKRAGSAQADVAAAHAPLQTYLRELPLVFRFAGVGVSPHGLTARYRPPVPPLPPSAPRTVDEAGAVLAQEGLAADVTALDLTLHALFENGRFLSLLRDYVAFDAGEDGLSKRIA